MEQDPFEHQLRAALQPMAAPAHLKARILQARERRALQQRRSFWQQAQQIAASLLVVAILAGGAWVHHLREEERKGAEARRQALLALRITLHALDNINQQLGAQAPQGESQ